MRALAPAHPAFPVAHPEGEPHVSITRSVIMERPESNIQALVPIENVMDGIMANINTLDASRYRRVRLSGVEQPLIAIQGFAPPRLSIIRTDSSRQGDQPRSTAKRPSSIRWWHRLLVIFGILAFIGGTGAVNSDPAQADVGPVKEYIWNKHDSSSNVVIGVTMTDGRYLTIAPGVRVNWNIRSFTIPAGWCANVTYNGGYPQKRYPGTHTSFVDGVVLSLNPYRQRSDGYCI